MNVPKKTQIKEQVEGPQQNIAKFAPDTPIKTPPRPYRGPSFTYTIGSCSDLRNN